MKCGDSSCIHNDAGICTVPEQIMINGSHKCTMYEQEMIQFTREEVNEFMKAMVDLINKKEIEYKENK